MALWLVLAALLRLIAEDKIKRLCTCGRCKDKIAGRSTT